jgi:hypothetical protein
MRRTLQSERSIPLVFAVLTVLGYGLLLGTAGFHWDDWGVAWAAKFLGPAQFIPSFSGFRPLLGPIFFITTSLIPPVPLYWQILALVIRFLISLSTWWAIKSIWPQRPGWALMLGLFMLVYPGYSQHWVALTHINQELIPLISYLLSFGVSARAIRRESIPLTALALLLQFWGLFPTEYFFGLELLRPVFIWSMLDEQHSLTRLRRTLGLWLPYMLLWLADAAWLFTLYRSDAYISYGIDTGSRLDLPGMILALGEAVLKAGFIAWGQILVLAGSTLTSPTSLLTFALILITFVLMLSFLWVAVPREEASQSLAILAILAGMAGIVLGRVPSLVAGLPLTLQTVFDRFTISMALGASLLAAGLIELLLGRSPRLKWAVTGLLVALAVGQQFFNANLFRRDWSRQQEIYWQMAWRMPAIEPGTLLLTREIPNMPLETDLSFTSPINWMYAPSYAGGDLPYALLYTEARLGGGALADLKPHMDVDLPFRTVWFHGSTDEALVLFFPEGGCMRVMDPGHGDAITYEKESAFLTQAIPLSDPGRILLRQQAQIPPFVDEPEHTWCTFYEKAELARQAGDWDVIIDLERAAQEQGLKPEDAFEWLPFIEARARTGDLERAAELTRLSLTQSARLRKGLCALWERLSDVSEGMVISAHMRQELNCTP